MRWRPVRISIIVPASGTFQDVDQGEYAAVTEGLATVISGSYGGVEWLNPQSQLETTNLINEIAAVSGIAANSRRAMMAIS